MKPSRSPALATAVLALCALSGCSTVASVATAPVRIVGSGLGKGVDMATTSQSEADEKRGREMRRREEKLGQLERRYEKHRRACTNGNAAACQDARSDYAEIQELMPRVPYESD